MGALFKLEILTCSLKKGLKGIVKVQTSLSKGYKLTLLIILFSACSVNKRNVVGLYISEHSNKSSIKIMSDGTFHFVKHDSYVDIPVSELFDNFRYYETTGNWELDSNNFILLTSICDPNKDNTPIVKKSLAVNDSLSMFTFFDMFGDTVPISFVHYSGTMNVFNFHYRFNSYQEDINKIDTLTFIIKDLFDNWSITKEECINYNYNIIMLPKYKPDMFNNYPLEIRRKKLIDSDTRYKKQKLSYQ